MSNYTIDPAVAAPGAHASARIGARAAASNARGTVISVPRSQLYYWSPVWQQNERAAIAEIARGEGVRFDDPLDAVRWLLREED